MSRARLTALAAGVMVLAAPPLWYCIWDRHRPGVVREDIRRAATEGPAPALMWAEGDFVLFTNTTLLDATPTLLMIHKPTSNTWTLDTRGSSIDDSLGQGARLYYDTANGHVTSIVLSLLGPAGAWVNVYDYNGDGIPDVRVFVGTRKRQIFYNGRFYDGTLSGGKHWIEASNTQVGVVFTNGTLVPVQ